MSSRIISKAIDLTNQSPDITNKYITEITNEGIRIHPNSGNHYIQLNSDGLDIVKNGSSLAQYGDITRIGKENDSHIVLNTDGIEIFKDGNAPINSIAKYGDTTRIGKESGGYITINSNRIQMLKSNSVVATFGVANSTQTIATAVVVNQELPTSSSSPLIVSTLSQAKSGSDIIVYTNWWDNDSSSIIADPFSLWVKFKKGTASTDMDIVYDGDTRFYTTSSKYTIDITRIKYYIDTTPPNIKLGTSTTDSALSIGQLVSNVNRDIFNINWAGDVTTTGDITALGNLELYGGDVITNGGDLSCGGGDVYCKDLYINNQPIWDHVIEQGTTETDSNEWIYRRWFSGIAECWGRIDVPTTTYAANGGYKAVGWTYPEDFFASTPVCLEVSGGIQTVVQTNIGFTANNNAATGQTYLINRNASSVSKPGWVFVHAIGTWETSTTSDEEPWEY